MSTVLLQCEESIDIYSYLFVLLLVLMDFIEATQIAVV